MENVSHLLKSWRYSRKVQALVAPFCPLTVLIDEEVKHAVISAVCLDCCLLQPKLVESCFQDFSVLIDQIYVFILAVLIMRTAFLNPWKETTLIKFSWGNIGIK